VFSFLKKRLDVFFYKKNIDCFSTQQILKKHVRQTSYQFKKYGCKSLQRNLAAAKAYLRWQKSLQNVKFGKKLLTFAGAKFSGIHYLLKNCLGQKPPKMFSFFIKYFCVNF